MAMHVGSPQERRASAGGAEKMRACAGSTGTMVMPPSWRQTRRTTVCTRILRPGKTKANVPPPLWPVDMSTVKTNANVPPPTIVAGGHVRRRVPARAPAGRRRTAPAAPATRAPPLGGSPTRRCGCGRQGSECLGFRIHAGGAKAGKVQGLGSRVQDA
eukprot:350629-Chlamydomonas_euryale.AAC.3